jgi:hypothetical protein
MHAKTIWRICQVNKAIQSQETRKRAERNEQKYKPYKGKIRKMI